MTKALYRNDLIVSWMENHDITVGDVRSKTQLSRDTITRARGGDPTITVERLFMIVSAIGFPEEALFNKKFRLPKNGEPSEKEEATLFA